MKGLTAEMHKKEKIARMEDASSTIKHTFCNERRAYEAKITELTAEVENLKHDLRIYNSNLKGGNKKDNIAIDIQRKNAEIEELYNNNIILDTTVNRFEKENQFLRSQLDDYKKNSTKFQDHVYKESDDLRREMDLFRKEAESLRIENSILKQDLSKAIKRVAEDRDEIDRLKSEKSFMTAERERSPVPL